MLIFNEIFTRQVTVELHTRQQLVTHSGAIFDLQTTRRIKMKSTYFPEWLYPCEDSQTDCQSITSSIN